MDTMDLDMEAMIVSLAVDRCQTRLIERGLLTKEIDSLKGLDYQKVVGYVYNKYLKTFLSRGYRLKDSDFSDLIYNLFVDDKIINLRKPLNPIPTGYDSYKQGSTVKLICLETKANITLNKMESILLQYKEGKNAENYFITILKNKVTTFKDHHMKSSVNNVYEEERDLYSKVTTNPCESKEYLQLKEDVSATAWEDYYNKEGVIIPVEHISLTLKLRGDLGFSLNDISRLFGVPTTHIKSMWDSLVYALYELAGTEEVAVSMEDLDRYTETYTSKVSLVLYKDVGNNVFTSLSSLYDALKAIDKTLIHEVKRVKNGLKFLQREGLLQYA